MMKLHIIVVLLVISFPAY
ncbi:TPA: type I toxin-antitoxin system Ibs family toxin [Escherichia coli]|nr:type I toxin-antitoxin system Ibs family toxin [Escherichia coli]EIH1050801.1 type I toxin-antitoxin system Ibs family toxin [Escherichia coli]EIH1055793.1 type I toxin-antitoxin system Ibs family toxin [Escherichia coli]MBV4605060.1 type I toxin-antitoxin system Ibs family toxin [Escherichia coli]MBV4664934.1 type I toxin-antitoxin system Ibs family toxin [Escherichia coli]MBV4694559.1 type I toxin-antitoxin system Ibs family toxin [Escherichia coli]